MSFKLAVISDSPTGLVRVAAYGDATSSDFPTPDKVYFDTLLGSGWNTQRVALDMDAVAYLDSAAISWLISSQKQFREGGGFLVLHNVQPHVCNILHLLKVERVVPICADGEAALAALKLSPQAQLT